MSIPNEFKEKGGFSPHFSIIAIYILVLAQITIPANSQNTIWYENFDNIPDGITMHAGQAGWDRNLQGASVSGHFEVVNHKYEANYVNSEVLWVSEYINIKYYQNVGVSIDLACAGVLESTDSINVYYRVDGGPAIPLNNAKHIDNFSPVTVTATGISGSKLQIIAHFRNGDTDEKHTIDNVYVTGVPVVMPNNLVWYETFNDLVDNTTVDNGTSAWTRDISATAISSVGYFEIRQYRLLGRDLNGEAVWKSGVINIAGHQSVDISADIYSYGLLESDDYIRVYYKLNGGAETLLTNGTITGAASDLVTAYKNGLSGSTIQFVTRMLNSSENECHVLDNILIKSNGAGFQVTATGGVITCANNTVSLSATATISGVTYSWSGPSGFTSSLQNPVVNIAGTYTVTATNPANGSTSAATAIVTQNTTPPDITATGGFVSCSGNVTLTANSTVSGATYSWTGPGGYTSTAQNPAVNTVGSYTVSVTNPANGCANSQTVQVMAETTSTLWFEDFSLADGTTTDNGTTSWSSTTPTGTFSVANNQFRVTNIGTSAEGLWTSGVIDITGKTNVTLSFDERSAITGSAVMNTSGTYMDYIRVYYKLNGGSEVLANETLGSINGHSTTSTTISIESLSGTSIQIIIRARASGSDEFYYLDNIKITGTTATNNITATASAGGSLTCTITSVTLSGSSNTLGVTYSWTGPNSFNSSAQNPTVSAPGTYNLTVSNGSCSGTATVTINQNTIIPGANATGGKLTCTATSITLTGSSSTTDVSYSWSGPGGFTSPVQNPTINIAGTYTLTVTNPTNGCTSNATANVILDKNTPSATASTNDTLTCNTISATLSSSSPTSGVTYNWTGPLTFASTEQNPATNHPGAYTVVVTDPANGCSSSANVTVVQDTSKATGVHADVSGAITCTVSSVTITGSSTTSGATYSWTGPNGFSSTNQNITISTPGNYILHVTKPSTGCVVAINATVVLDTITPKGVVAEASGILSCTRSSVVLIGSSTTNGVSYNWVGPNFASTEASATVTNPGSYFLTVTNPVNGCSSNTSVIVIKDLTLPESVTTSVSGTLTCANPNVTLSAFSSTPGVVYYWTGPGTYTSNERTPVASNPGTYLVTVTNPYNDCSVRDSIKVLQNKISPEGVNAYATGLITCANLSVTLNSFSSTPGVNYSWAGPAGYASSLQNPIVSAVGTYTLTVINPANGCSTIIPVTVDQDKTKPANVSASVSGNLNCVNAFVTLTGASSTSGAEYYWTGPYEFEANSDTTFTIDPGNYTLIVTNPNNGCKDSACIIVLHDTVSPISHIVQPAYSPLALTNDTLYAQSLNNVSYLWGLSSANANWSIVSGNNTQTLIYHAGTAETNATFTLTVTSNQNGCSSTKQIFLTAVSSKSSFHITDSQGIDKAFQVKAYPNPFSEKAVIEFTPDQDGQMTLELYTNQGVLSEVLFNGYVHEAQSYKIITDGTGMPAGSYYCIIRFSDHVYSCKLILIKI